MEVIEYHILADNLDERIIAALKTLFKGQEITISVKSAVNEQSSAPITMPRRLLDIIEENEKSEFAYQFSGETFSQLVKQFSDNPDFDLTAAFEQHKSVKIAHEEVRN